MSQWTGATHQNFGRRCIMFPEIVPLLQTKICDLQYPISDLTQNPIPYFRSLKLLHESANQEWLLYLIL